MVLLYLPFFCIIHLWFYNILGIHQSLDVSYLFRFYYTALFIYISAYMPVCLNIFLSLYLFVSICVYILCLSVFLSVSVCVFCLSDFFSLSQCACVAVCLSFLLPISHSIECLYCSISLTNFL